MVIKMTVIATGQGNIVFKARENLMGNLIVQ